jgi:hypothetical protein
MHGRALNLAGFLLVGIAGKYNLQVIRDAEVQIAILCEEI